MLEGGISFFRLQRLFQLFLLLLFSFFALFGAWFLVTYRSVQREPFPVLLKEKKIKTKKEFESYSFSKALEERKEIALTLPSLQKEISFCHAAKRKDQEEKDQHIILTTSSLEACFVKSGLPVYIDYDKESKSLILGKKETPLSLIPGVLSDDSLSATAYLALPSIEIKTPLVLGEKEECIDWKVSEEFKKQVKPLHKAIGYPPDALFKLYGGKEYGKMGNLYRLEMDKDLLFLQKGDLFIWDNKCWRKPLPQEDTRLYPLAEVVKANDQKIELSVFDISGQQFVQISIPIALPKGKGYNFSELFLRAKKRTPHSISCRLGGKNMILQEGDWLIQRGKGWHVLQSQEELKALLEYELKEDLIVIDKIEENHLTGHYFDPRRSQSQKIAISLVDGKKSNDSQKKKIRKSATIEGYDSNL